ILRPTRLTKARLPRTQAPAPPMAGRHLEMEMGTVTETEKAVATSAERAARNEDTRIQIQITARRFHGGTRRLHRGHQPSRSRNAGRDRNRSAQREGRASPRQEPGGTGAFAG